jgi:ribosomal protein L11 methyltransferase
MTCQPPEDLIIYETAGVWPGDERPDLGTDFLGLWVEAEYTFFFFRRDARAIMDEFLSRRDFLTLRTVHRMKYWEWQDGARFHPFRVGPLTLVPAWDPVPALPVRGQLPPLRIDPGLAFGFGGHPTTRACLKMVVRVYDEDVPESVLDLGSGTGVLALAAARLGARAVKAVEYSHVAVDAARNNVMLNEYGDRIDVVRGRAEDYALYPADLIMSNLHLAVQDVILGLGGFDHRCWLIISGLFHAEAETLEKKLVAKGCILVDRIRDDRWVTLLFRAGRQRCRR